MTDMEDRCRRNNVRLVGLQKGEGPMRWFPQANLSKWIPSLRGRDIEIDRAHRVYDGGRGSDRPHSHLPCTEMAWQIRYPERCSAGYPVKCAQNNVTLLFFPDFSPATAIRRKAFGPVLKKMTALGLQPFLIYPAVIKLRHKGEQRVRFPTESGGFYQLHVSAEVVCRALRGHGEQRPLSPAREADGRDGRLAAQKGWCRMDMKPNLFLLFFFLLLGYCPYYPVQQSLCW